MRVIRHVKESLEQDRYHVEGSDLSKHEVSVIVLNKNARYYNVIGYFIVREISFYCDNIFRGYDFEVKKNYASNKCK